MKKHLIAALALALWAPGALAQTAGTGTVKIPDGNDKALGSTSQNPWGGEGAATLIEITKGIYKQAVPLGSAGSPQSNAVLTIQGVNSMTPLFVGQPLDTAIGSITGAPLALGYVTAATPNYTSHEGKTWPLSIDATGALRVNALTGFIPAIGAIGDSAYTWDNGNATVISLLKGLGGLALETGTGGTPSTDVMTVQGCATCTGVKVGDALGADVSGKAGVVVQGVSTTSAPTYADNKINALSLDASGALRVTGSLGGYTQGDASAGKTGAMVQSVTTTAAPSYSNATINPLSSDSKGNLRVAAGGDVCQSQPHTFTSISLTGNTQLVAAVTNPSNKKIYVCGLMVIANAAETISLVTGTGSTCGTGTAGMVGGATASIALAANQGFALGNGGFAMAESASGGAVCLLKSGSVQVSGVLVSAVEP
jgi:hypothetical protein